MIRRYVLARIGPFTTTVWMKDGKLIKRVTVRDA